jgi:hypothetical protein
MIAHVGLQKQMIQRYGFYGVYDFPIFMKKALADRKQDVSLDKLLDLMDVSVEAVDDPSLLGMVLLV